MCDLIQLFGGSQCLCSINFKVVGNLVTGCFGHNIKFILRFQIIWSLVVERLSTDIEWSVEIHCSSDDRSGTSVHRFIIITEDFIIFSYLSLCI